MLWWNFIPFGVVVYSLVQRFILQGKAATLISWGGLSLYFQFHLTFFMLLGNSTHSLTHLSVVFRILQVPMCSKRRMKRRYPVFLSLLFVATPTSENRKRFQFHFQQICNEREENDNLTSVYNALTACVMSFSWNNWLLVHVCLVVAYTVCSLHQGNKELNKLR